MKKIMKVLMLAMTCLMLFTACKEEAKPAGEDKLVVEESEIEETYNFAYSCITMDNPYFIALESSLRASLEAEGHTLITKDAKTNAQLQAEQITELIEQGIDAIFLSPVDWIEITPSIEKLNEAGIKIINIDTKVQVIDKVDAYVGSDNTNAGYLCGADLLERLPNGGKIVIVECPNRNSINERIQGFEKAIAKKGFEVVARIDAQGNLEDALPQVEEVLKNNSDIVAIMCGNDPCALGALVAANTVGANDLIIYGIDGSPEVKKELLKDTSLIAGSVGQSTEIMAQEAATVALKLMADEKIQKTTYIDTFLITKENVTEYGVDTWQ